MELRDFIVTPIVIIIVYGFAYKIRPYLTDFVNQKYFLPALTVRIIGALAVGLLYQFYYEGGDTFNFHTHGSRHVWEAFMESPQTGFAILFSNENYSLGTYKYVSKIIFYDDPASFFIVRIATIFDIFTFSSYSATAVMFSVVGFLGSWMLFRTFYEIYPHLHKWIALASLFMPSVVFWGSGIFKDTITLAALGVLTFSFHSMFFRNKITLINLVFFIIGLFTIYSIKKYVLLSFLPAIIVWIFAHKLTSVRSLILRGLLTPAIIILVVLFAYAAVYKVGEDDPRYSISKLAQTAKITAYDIRYGWGARSGEGSGYTLGSLDGTWSSMIRLAPSAINVSLFRPYFWEISNPLMLLSSIESSMMLILTLYTMTRIRINSFRSESVPEVLFCLTFGIIFAFAVGVSTYNFGTLSRYKIPMMPFYLMALILLIETKNHEKRRYD